MEAIMNDDTIKLLRECDAGVKMGISGLDDALKSVDDQELRDILQESRKQHTRLDDEINKLLDKYHDDGKEPAAMAKFFSKLKTNMKAMSDDVNKALAGVMTDGCNMGIKSLNKYMNQYPNANMEAVKLTKDIIAIEEKLKDKLEKFL